MIAEPAIFTCSICGERSTDICAYCTKDACANHRCIRCKRCSDCCECEVPLSAAEVPAEPEAVAASAAEAVNMAAAKAAGEAAVLPRAIDVIVGIIATGIVTDPSVVVMDVRGLRVIGPITERRAIIFWGAGIRRPILWRAILLWAIVGRP